MIVQTHRRMYMPTPVKAENLLVKRLQALLAIHEPAEIDLARLARDAENLINKTKSKDAEPYCILGGVRFLQGKYQEGKNLFEMAMSFDSYPELHSNYANMLRASLFFEESSRVLDKAVIQFPGNTELLFEAFDAAFLNIDIEKAIAYARQMMNLRLEITDDTYISFLSYLSNDGVDDSVAAFVEKVRNRKCSYNDLRSVLNTALDVIRKKHVISVSVDVLFLLDPDLDLDLDITVYVSGTPESISETNSMIINEIINNHTDSFIDIFTVSCNCATD